MSCCNSCATMTSYISKMPNVARQAVGYLGHLFGGASTSSRVGSVDTSSKTGVNGTANGQNKMNGSSVKSNDQEKITTTQPHPRHRSLDAEEIMNWEPDAMEKELIKATWSDDFDFLYNLGSNIYIFIFTQVPECKTLFPAIHAHGDNYRESREFRSQALKFVQTIAYAVKNIYHMNNVAPHLHKIGERHVKFADRGFKTEHWDVFLDAMEHALTDQINSINMDAEKRQKTVKVWRRLAFYIICHMKSGYFAELKRQKM
ncbi:GLOBIN domain-containing protein [Aphelenchoides besseyi]|nr:GLOBIN domain-containing protein [Aphelenchoides besseyi]